jgi:[ribosomal protein S5]-alanine N-acetyltransferase
LKVVCPEQDNNLDFQESSPKFSMSKDHWNVTLSTERLILRPLQPSNYEAWYAGFVNRLPNQRKYDAGFIDLDGCDLKWFTQLCQRHQELALTDQVYIFGIFLQETNQHLGNIDISTIRRKENHWANLGDPDPKKWTQS